MNYKVHCADMNKFEKLITAFIEYSHKELNVESPGCNWEDKIIDRIIRMSIPDHQIIMNERIISWMNSKNISVDVDNGSA